MKLEMFRVLGANRKELRASFLVALFGFVLVSLVFPPVAREYDGPNLHLPFNLARSASYFVIAIVSFFCALNAYRDEKNFADKRILILIWCIVFFLGVCFSVRSVLPLESTASQI